jgi:hypothetical protein
VVVAKEGGGKIEGRNSKKGIQRKAFGRKVLVVMTAAF